MTGDADPVWLLVSISTAGGSGTLRVQVWRRLRSLGALYVQQSVCLLPALPEVERQVRRLLDRVHDGGGTGRVLRVELAEAGERAEIVAEFNAARDAEYGEVLERLPELRRELETELAKGRATYAEVEESEADLARFRDWMGKIDARDYFQAPMGVAAHTALQEAADALVAFEQAAWAAEIPGETTSADDQPRAGRRLRAAGDS